MKNNIVLSIIITIGLTFSFSNYAVDNVKLNIELIEACKKGDIILVKKLISIGANINAKCKEKKYSCLNWASHNGNLLLVKYLIGNAGRLKIYQDLPFYTILGIAILKGYPDLARYILLKFSTIIIKEEKNYYLLFASKYNNLEIIKLLIQHGSDVNTMNNYGQTPLNWAARIGYFETVKYLVSKGADVNLRKDFWAMTALMNAAENNNTEIVKLLLEKGAKTEFHDYHGYTALITASIRGYIEIVKLLVSKGANINARDFRGATALKHAIWNNRRNIANYLRSVGAR